MLVFQVSSFKFQVAKPGELWPKGCPHLLSVLRHFSSIDGQRSALGGHGGFGLDLAFSLRHFLVPSVGLNLPVAFFPLSLKLPFLSLCSR